MFRFVGYTLKQSWSSLLRFSSRFVVLALWYDAFIGTERLKNCCDVCCKVDDCE